VNGPGIAAGDLASDFVSELSKGLELSFEDFKVIGFNLVL
jgi:hypothetical protein